MCIVSTATTTTTTAASTTAICITTFVGVEVIFFNEQGYFREWAEKVPSSKMFKGYPFFSSFKANNNNNNTNNTQTHTDTHTD